MPPQIPPLDEQEFNNPDVLLGLPGGNLNSDSIMWYFMNSQFFDPVSNNTSLFNQLRSDPLAQPILNDRRLFEHRLRSNYPTGLQFLVVSEPQTPQEPWVIQRQYRTADGETQVQGTYFTLGTRILMAPSLLDVVRGRMLSVSTYLEEVFEKSREMTHFAPATNHSYLPAKYDVSKASNASRIGSRLGSRLGSPTLAATEPENAVPSSQGQAQAQNQTQGQEATSDATTAFSDALFMSSLQLTNTYYNEFMDENPLTGEPGAFVYTNTYDAVLSRNQAQERAQERAQQQKQQASQNTQTPTSSTPNFSNANNNAIIKPEIRSATNSVAATPKTGTVGTPAAASAAAVALESHSRKGSTAGVPKLGGKEKRRKSKGLASPVTPTAGHHAAGGGGGGGI
ncbi:hypothetical protein CC80DRAFT_488464 [Byssothecium circinans]|uniref:Mediator of RNA polymerase II transcription subunit 6 n=1 Tax=Byssothecium circinans TaxID=147558 RepID=A0A6A5U9W5_9PLEO|nr:hypothetical protein CC80DRAFT_488464 [Byssothecium circinans]